MTLIESVIAGLRQDGNNQNSTSEEHKAKSPSLR